MLAAVLRRSMAVRVLAIVLAGIAPLSAQGVARWNTPTQAEIDSIFPDIDALYVDLHRKPELGFQETQTAATLAARLKALGFDVTTGVEKTGVVGVLRNGTGPTVMLRPELDALPVEEKTGLPFASRVVMKNAAGREPALKGAIRAETTALLELLRAQ